MDSGSRQLISETTIGAGGLAVALHAAAQAAARHQAMVRWNQRQARIEARQRVVAAKNDRNRAMLRELSVIRAHIALLTTR